ncbi:MAG: LuxR C-terminal-related transcriptional regulator [Acidimicrobiia bacterium]
MMSPIRVAVFEPDEIFRRGVVSCLAEDPLLDVVQQGADYDHGAGDGPVPFDVAVVSATLDGAPSACPLVACVGNGIGTVEGPHEENVYAILCRRTLAPDQLVSAVRAAAVGLRIIDSSAVRPDFDQRSLQVLRMLADGAAIREISASLGWSERTIKGVIADVQREFQARTRTQAVVEAVRRELI